MIGPATLHRFVSPRIHHWCDLLVGGTLYLVPR
jgi:hypothetical protein